MEGINELSSDYSTRRKLSSGANWFYWLAALSIMNSLVVFYFGTKNSLIALGITQWVDGTSGGLSREGFAPPMSVIGLMVNLLIALGFAGFGYFARNRHDFAFVIGMGLYVVDALLVLGLKDFFGFGFHMVALFFIFKGLLASRHLRENATTI